MSASTPEGEMPPLPKPLAFFKQEELGQKFLLHWCTPGLPGNVPAGAEPLFDKAAMHAYARATSAAQAASGGAEPTEAQMDAAMGEAFRDGVPVNLTRETLRRMLGAAFRVLREEVATREGPSDAEMLAGCTYPACRCVIDAIGQLECQRPPCRDLRGVKPTYKGQDVPSLLFDIRGAMLRYGIAVKNDDGDGIRSTSTEACELLDRLGALASGVHVRLLVTVCELRDGDGLTHCAMLHHEGQRAIDGMCVERRADKSEVECEAEAWREFLAASSTDGSGVKGGGNA